MKPLTRRALCGPLRPAGPLVALGAVAVLAASGCGQAGAPASTTTPAGEQTVTSAGVRLEATMGVGLPKHPAGDGIRRMPGLVVDYTLTNTGTKPLLAYDVVPDDLGSATLPKDVNPEHAWVFVDSGVLRVSKQAFAPAAGVRFVAAPMTGAHALDAGASLTGRAYAVSPPVLDVPGESFEAPRAVVDAAVGQWQFCVQVGERTGAERPAAAGGGVLEAPTVAPSGDDLVCTQPATIPVA